jgi:hypothetical protein
MSRIALLLTGSTAEARVFRAAVEASGGDASEFVLLGTDRSVRGAVRRPWSLNALAAAKDEDCDLLLVPSSRNPLHDRWFRWLGARRGIDVRCLSRPRVDRRGAKDPWDAEVLWWL